MLSKPIFKQSIKTNWKLWLIITVVASIIFSGFILSYDAVEYAELAIASENTSFSSLFSSMTSLLGSLENFYKLIAVILGIVYVIFTANNLVVNEVDSGSMAYTLSTPIKRSSVIFTKTLYLILSVGLMYTIISLVGLGAAQLEYNNVTGYPITDDIEAAADSLNHDKRYLSDRLYLIQEDEQAMSEAAAARDMDIDAYSVYLEDRIINRSYEEAADVITDDRWDIYKDDDDMEDDDIEITTDELKEEPKMILENNDALAAGAKAQGISINDYHQFVTEEIKNLEDEEENEEEPDTEVMITEGNTDLLLQSVIDTSATALNMDREQVEDNLTLIKDPTALKEATEVTGLNEEQVTTLANHAMVSSARSADEALDLDTEAYLWLSLGLLLLILAMSSIAFFASTLFNRTGLALAVGGGIPFAFFLITMVQQLMEDTDGLEYLTITSLFDIDEILINGDFGWGLIILGGISLVLYTLSNIIFTKKDLPL